MQDLGKHLEDLLEIEEAIEIEAQALAFGVTPKFAAAAAGEHRKGSWSDDPTLQLAHLLRLLSTVIVQADLDLVDNPEAAKLRQLDRAERVAYRILAGERFPGVFVEDHCDGG